MSLAEDDKLRGVFNDEMEKWIIPRRKREDPIQEPSKDGDEYLPKVNNKLVGLALSGGGIRSATYVLGALQRLARLGILKFVDVLSTASGGGYFGASWSSLTADGPKFGSTEANFPFRFIDNDEDSKGQIFDRESDAVRHLRAHGNLLLPHLGLFDVWTWVAVFRYVLSTIINLLLIPIPWILGIVLLTLIIPSGFWNREAPWDSSINLLMIIGPAILFVIFLVFVWWKPRPTDVGAEIKHSFYWLQKSALIVGVIWVLVDLFILCIAGAYHLEAALKIQLNTWLSTAGGSGAALAAVVGAIYRFFTGDM